MSRLIAGMNWKDPFLTKTPKPRRPEQTRLALMAAAAKEIERHGYEGTNSNKIAKEAGYAPQTFYRHFENKLQIFLALYQEWGEQSGNTLDDTRDANDAALFLVGHHKKFLNFRRALRHLAIVEPDVRSARAMSRLNQVEYIKKRLSHLAKASSQKLLVNLLQIERLADAYAEREFADLGISEEFALAELARLIQSAFGLHSN